MKKNYLSNTLRTPVTRSLRAIKKNRFQSLVLVPTLEPGTQNSSTSNGNTTSVIMNKKPKFEAVTFSKWKTRTDLYWVERKELLPSPNQR